MCLRQLCLVTTGASGVLVRDELQAESTRMNVSRAFRAGMTGRADGFVPPHGRMRELFEAKVLDVWPAGSSQQARAMAGSSQQESDSRSKPEQCRSRECRCGIPLVRSSTTRAGPHSSPGRRERQAAQARVRTRIVSNAVESTRFLYEYHGWRSYTALSLYSQPMRCTLG